MPRRQTNPDLSLPPSSATATMVHPRLSTMPSLSSTFPRERSSAIDLNTETVETLSRLTAEGNQLFY